MTKLFSEIKFDRELKLVKKFDQWLIQNGIKTSGSRLHEVIGLLKIIVDHYKADKVTQLRSNYDEATLWVVLTDATAFVRIYLAFRNTKSHELPRTEFKKMIAAPLLPWDESPNKNNIHGRNTLFELEMATVFKNADLKITNYDDVQFDFKNKQFNVQCKRIHSSKGVAANVSNAVAQMLQ